MVVICRRNQERLEKGFARKKNIFCLNLNKKDVQELVLFISKSNILFRHSLFMSFPIL